MIAFSLGLVIATITTRLRQRLLLMGQVWLFTRSSAAFFTRWLDAFSASHLFYQKQAILHVSVIFTRGVICVLHTTCISTIWDPDASWCDESSKGGSSARRTLLSNDTSIQQGRWEGGEHLKVLHGRVYSALRPAPEALHTMIRRSGIVDKHYG